VARTSVTGVHTVIVHAAHLGQSGSYTVRLTLEPGP
jgi:hypothetical protein